MRLLIGRWGVFFALAVIILSAAPARALPRPVVLAQAQKSPYAGKPWLLNCATIGQGRFQTMFTKSAASAVYQDKQGRSTNKKTPGRAFSDVTLQAGITDVTFVGWQQSTSQGGGDAATRRRRADALARTCVLTLLGPKNEARLRYTIRQASPKILMTVPSGIRAQVGVRRLVLSSGGLTLTK